MQADPCQLATSTELVGKHSSLDSQGPRANVECLLRKGFASRTSRQMSEGISPSDKDFGVKSGNSPEIVHKILKAKFISVCYFTRRLMSMRINQC